MLRFTAVIMDGSGWCAGRAPRPLKSLVPERSSNWLARRFSAKRRHDALRGHTVRRGWRHHALVQQLPESFIEDANFVPVEPPFLVTNAREHAAGHRTADYSSPYPGPVPRSAVSNKSRARSDKGCESIVANPYQRVRKPRFARVSGVRW